jgi:hypothetical protein
LRALRHRLAADAWVLGDDVLDVAVPGRQEALRVALVGRAQARYVLRREIVALGEMARGDGVVIGLPGGAEDRQAGRLADDDVAVRVARDGRAALEISRRLLLRHRRRDVVEAIRELVEALA